MYVGTDLIVFARKWAEEWEKTRTELLELDADLNAIPIVQEDTEYSRVVKKKMDKEKGNG